MDAGEDQQNNIESEEDPEEEIYEEEVEIHEECDKDQEEEIYEEVVEIYEESEEDPEEEIDEEPEEDPEEEIIEDPEEDPSSINDACTAAYQVENASKFGPATFEGCKSQEKFSSEESSKSKSDVTSGVGEHDGETGHSKVIVDGDYASKQQEHGGSSVKRKKSRWEQDDETFQIDGNSKRRKTRWDDSDSQCSLFKLPGFINALELSRDAEVVRLKMKLMKVNKQIESLETYDEIPSEKRSPSPEPVYNSAGVRINTRHARIKKKLKKLKYKRNRIVSKLGNTNLTFEIPIKHKSREFVKKLFVPEKEYPTYNFIGLILGPKGNTQKKMEKETGAKIFLRGKGSGESESEDEDLHVRVEAYNQQALDAAAAMIEKLLIPVEDQKNDHKRAQLTELAKLRGTYKDNNGCNLCKEQGHRSYACPLQDSTFNAVCCDICGSFGHSTSNCSVSRQAVFGSKDKPNKEVDPATLYVGYLSHAIDENRLKELFLPFGNIIKTTIIKDYATGLSKGYGFVKFENPSDAAAAITYMHGYKMDGKMLAVRVAGQKPVPGPTQLGNVPIQSAHSNIGSLYFPAFSSYPGHYINVAPTEALTIPPYVMASTVDPKVTSILALGREPSSQTPSLLSNLVSQFPGYPALPNSQLSSYFTGPTMNGTQAVHPSQTPVSNQDSSFWSTFRFS